MRCSGDGYKGKAHINGYAWGKFPIQLNDRLVFLLGSSLVNEADWKLSVSDNSAGMATQTPGRKSGLGTSLIKALAQQMDDKVEIATSATGTTVNVTCANFKALLPTVA
jgi:two-component sensor histidine kinase